ncbi:hypothetical protein H8B09_26860 [Paenibacillus sp. PR3]|uniref:Molecular chaperone DnaJ n=1 Tax=Paenibacillus terricola TaxID=2763503 RepID=A0ABR8N2K5_9BACL|nr:hypothetical protein [Paenibacillus terricola]MBD3922403.1 hypothetical protein [Paenibacillus terricola]
MKVELMYASTHRACEVCSGTGRQLSVCTQQSRIPDGDAAQTQSNHSTNSASLCNHCAGVGSLRVERVAALSFEASLISLGIAICVAGYTGKPLLIAMLLALVLFAARMISFRTERYLLIDRRHRSRCGSSLR